VAAFWIIEFGHLVAAMGLVAAPPYPEVAYAYSGAEFNDQFGPAAATRLARARAEERLKRKDIRRARYQRMHDKHRQYAHPTKYVVVAEEVADNHYSPHAPR